NGCSASSPDRAAHGGEELVAWLLDQAHAYEQAHGTRILHYLDLHYYPQGGNPPDNLRSLYDATYTDPSYIADQIDLVPRMHAWVDQHYPGTKLAISEYDFAHHDEPLGAVTYAEVLGIFGREGLDLATAWSPPAATEHAYGAFMLYLNYDGHGAKFEATHVKTTVTGTGVAAFASTGPDRMTIVLVNETADASSVTVQLQNFGTGAMAGYFTGDSPTITQQPDVALGGTITVSVPAMSFALLAVPRDVPLGDDSAGTRDGGVAMTSSSGGGYCQAGESPTSPLLIVVLGFAMLRRRGAN
ncbi:MAG TPA: glycoside hydrolase family 44 protein, partial [Kofleriaceae bacterium]